MNGNRDEVLASLFASHYTSLIDAAEKYVFAFYPDRSEIIQDAIGALFKEMDSSYETLVNHPDQKSWMFKTLFNRLFALTKKSRVYYERTVLLATAVLDDMVSRDAFENWHDQEAYRRLLEALKPIRRDALDHEIFREYFLQGMSLKQIAALHDKSESAIKSKVYRMRKRATNMFDSLDGLREYLDGESLTGM